MKKIDSYILKKYLTTFFFCLFLFTIVVVVIDLSEKTDDFVRIKFSTWRIITDYEIGFIPHIDALLFPVFVFISVIFFTSKMAERSEVIAILSMGVSFRRFLLPYWIASIFLALILWVGYRNVLPKANEIWGSFLSKYIDSQSREASENSRLQNVYFRADADSYAGVRTYDTTNKAGFIFFVQKFKNKQLVFNLRAQSITWDTAKHEWKLNQVVEHTFNGDKETIKYFPTEVKNYSFKPQDLSTDDYFKDRLSSAELKDYITKEKMMGGDNVSTLMVEFYNRDAIPASIIILTIIAATVSSRKIRGGSGFHLGIGVILSVLYNLCSQFSNVFAQKGNFPPMLASWTPNIIFGVLAFYLYTRAAR